MRAESPETESLHHAQSARTALILLALLNLLSMAARYVLPGVQTLVQSEFWLNSRQTGTLSSAFFLIFMISAPLAGWLGDRLPRKPLLVGATLFWCAFTFFTAISRSYTTLLFNHAVFAAGEATFAVIAPPVIADFYPERRRNLVMTLYATTLPVGTALGYALGGWLSGARSWRFPLIVVSVAGVLAAALAALFLREPRRGATDPATLPPGRSAFKALARNPTYTSLVVSSVCLASAMVGTMVWLPTLFVRQSNLPLALIGRHLGLLTLCDGVGGVIAGGLLAQHFVATYRGALYTIPACAMLLALFFGTLVCFGPPSLRYSATAAMQISFFLATAPMAVAFLNAVDASVRASALALSLFATHAMGDGVSPTLIGWIADHNSLRAGIEVALLPLLIGAASLWHAGRFVHSKAMQPEQGLGATGNHRTVEAQAPRAR